MSSIRILPPDLVNQIAAGEVIERPASVVKELVENAIDAGAGTIAIEMKGSGCELIRVSDDGSGMTAQEIETAILRHATSKISKVDDLFAIKTLGFRGEALPSILSVSRAVIASRHADAEHGNSLVIEGGTLVKRGLRGMPPGTTIEIADLFFNTPARRKFLKTTATEQRSVIDVATRYGLAYPELRFALSINDRSVMNLPGGSTLDSRAASLLGSRLSGRLMPFGREMPGITVSGLLAGPEEARQNRTGIHAFVNRRSVKDAMLGAAVIEGYSGVLMKGRYPVTVLFVDIDPAEVDVNVHPSKSEVRFSHPGAVFGLVASAIRDALVPRGSCDEGFPGTCKPIQAQDHDVRQGHPGWYKAGASTRAGDSGLQIREDPSVTYGPRALSQLQTGRLFDDDHSGTQVGFSYAGLSAVGTFHATYVLFQDNEALYIMDQHAAHERITYERLRRAHSSGYRAGQALLTPRVIDLSAREYAAFEEAAEAIREMGIECEHFGESSIVVRTVPQPLADKDIEEVIHGVIHAIMEGEFPAATSGNPFEEILATVACHSSVRAGKALTIQEAQCLLEELVAEGSPRTCPHGRPLFRRIPFQEVERWLGRRA